MPPINITVVHGGNENAHLFKFQDKRKKKQKINLEISMQ